MDWIAWLYFRPFRLRRNSASFMREGRELLRRNYLLQLTIQTGTFDRCLKESPVVLCSCD